MTTMNTVEDVYRGFKDVVILHAISFDGPVSDVPKFKTFADRIRHTKESSRKEKIFAFSIQFGKGPIDNKVFGSRASAGIGIKTGKIFRHFRGDTGKTNSRIQNAPVRDNDDINDVIKGENDSHNEFILTDVEPCCIYFYKGLWGFSRDEVIDACRIHQLTIYELAEGGLRRYNSPAT